MLDSTDRADSGSTRIAMAALAGQSVFLGCNWVVMKIGLRYASVWPFAAMRTGLGAVALFLLILVLKRPMRPKHVFLTVLLGLLQTTAQIGLLMWALESGSAGRTSALVYTMPFWALLFARLFLGERLMRVQWLAVSLAVVGLVAILDPLNLKGSLASKLMAVGAGAAWAASTIVAKKIRRRGPVDVLNLTAWQMLFGTIPIAVVALVHTTRPIVWAPAFVGALVYNVILATAVAWFLWLYVLQVLPAGIAGLGTLATPVIGVVSSWLLLREKVGVFEGVGILLILAALLVLTLVGVTARRQAQSVAVAAARAPARVRLPE
ncbi:MAG TPA: DMT family transporter [Thermoleophilia bacterium]